MTAIDTVVRQLRLPAVESESDLALLDAAERDRADRYRRTEDRVSFVEGRAALRRVLADRLGFAADRIVFGHSACPGCGSADHGPPRISSPATPVTFSFSRAKRHALVAVAPSGPVGADIEVLRPIDIREMAGQCLSPTEAAYILRLPPEEGLRAFYRAWVRKEAVTKAVGVGIVLDLRTVEVRPERPGAVTVTCGAGAGPGSWTVTDMDGGPRVAAALALPDAGRRPQFMRDAGDFSQRIT
ncbi:4'-phosphopantetheinyl transferase family protein [Streptomyces sp. NPDC091266]|uniref:4'-phosphopantetheinyl transferase family protein n=1 Tax=Streptomyces sp. NPDC091266 TaxID=3365978 RepID=UPI0038171DAA